MPLSSLYYLDVYESFRGQTNLAKMKLLWELACHLTKKVNKAENPTCLSSNIDLEKIGNFLLKVI
jgi:hypothetical protein